LFGAAGLEEPEWLQDVRGDVREVAKLTIGESEKSETL
jgi:hypothetical protein